MSFKWTVPAFQCKVGNAIKKLILIKLADQANDDGECWPSQNSLAEAAECSRRTVASHIKSLSADGYIQVENRIRGDGSKCSNMYRLVFHMDGKPLHNPCANISHAPCANISHHEPINNEPIKEPTPISQDVASGSTQSKAEEIYSIYPRKVGKGNAINAIKKALKKVSYETLLMAVEEYAFSQDGRKNTNYIPHCSTWMNHERWEDDREEWRAWKRDEFNLPKQPDLNLDGPGWEGAYE